MLFDVWEEIGFRHRGFAEEFIGASLASPVFTTTGSFAPVTVEAIASDDWQGDALRALRGGIMFNRGDMDWNDPQMHPGEGIGVRPWLVEEPGGDHFVFIERPSDSGSADKSGGTMTMSAEQEIVITGKRNASGTFDWYVNGVSGSGGPPLHNGDDSIEPGTEPVLSDEDVVEITVKINRPLGESEKTAIENLKVTIAAMKQLLEI